VTLAVLEQPSLELPTAQVVDLRYTRSDNTARRLEQHVRHGLPVEPDPHRPDFYDALVDDKRCWFYVKQSFPPRVYLLAAW
jgi:hypothetical protein